MLGGVTCHMFPQLPGVPYLQTDPKLVNHTARIKKNPQVALLENYSPQIKIFSHQFV